MRNLLLAWFGEFVGISLVLIFSGCASIEAPKATVYTNIPFFHNSGITVRNSAGPDVVITPQSRGDGFVAEYRYEKGSLKTLWIPKKIPTKLVTLAHGESVTIPLYRNHTDQTVYVPFAVKVIQGKGVLGSYSYCVAVYPGQDNNLEFNFGPRELQALKQGNTGYPCRR